MQQINGRKLDYGYSSLLPLRIAYNSAEAMRRVRSYDQYAGNHSEGEYGAVGVAAYVLIGMAIAGGAGLTAERAVCRALFTRLRQKRSLQPSARALCSGAEGSTLPR